MSFALGNGDGQNSLSKYAKFDGFGKSLQEIADGWASFHTTTIPFLEDNGYTAFNIIETKNRPLNETEVGRDLLPYLWKFRAYNTEPHLFEANITSNQANKSFNRFDDSIVRKIKKLDWNLFDDAPFNDNYRASEYLPIFQNFGGDVPNPRNIISGRLIGTFFDSSTGATRVTRDTPEEGLQFSRSRGSTSGQSVVHDFLGAVSWEPAHNMQYVYQTPQGGQLGCMFGTVLRYMYDVKVTDAVQTFGRYEGAFDVYRTTEYVNYAGFGEPFGTFGTQGGFEIKDYVGASSQSITFEPVAFGDFQLIKTTVKVNWKQSEISSNPNINFRGDVSSGVAKGAVGNFTGSVQDLVPIFYKSTGS